MVGPEGFSINFVLGGLVAGIVAVTIAGFVGHMLCNLVGLDPVPGVEKACTFLAYLMSTLIAVPFIIYYRWLGIGILAGVVIRLFVRLRITS